MKKFLSLVLAVLMTAFMFAACSSEKTDLSGVASLTDLAGAKIAAQAGTFHADALAQIKNAKTSTYPDFTDLLNALNSGAVDGYIAEEPTALAVCMANDKLDYVHLKNNDTGFTATAADVGIAVGLVTGSELVAKINDVIATISTETRAALMQQMVTLSNGGTISGELALISETPATPTGTLKVAMECAYQPYNWTETGAKTAGAVAISGEGKDGLYANGYDVQVAKYIANKLGMKLEIYAIEWDSLLPALQSGTVDAIIAGMSPTADRELEIDFTNVYYESNLVVIYKKK